MRNYMKKKLESFERAACIEKIKSAVFLKALVEHKKALFILGAFILVIPMAFAILAHKEFRSVSLGEENTIELAGNPIAVTSGKKGVITIPAGTVKTNPFLPYRDLGDSIPVADVPAFSLVEPPDAVNENSDAARVMDTIVSGILYDKYSPSAILNIEGNDYLVKKGDVVNNYKVVNILEDSVTVKLGKNVYQAGIGEILTEGAMNHNNVSNLNNKFGGVR